MNAARCLRCDGPKPASRSHFCDDCRRDLQRERNRENMKERRQRARDIIANLPEDLRMRVDDADYEALDLDSKRLPDEVSIRLAEFMDETAQGADEDGRLIRDKMPDGASTPAGPDEGRSTFFRELAGELDDLCRIAARDPWWRANPHWNYELHDPGKASRYMRLG